MKVNLYSAEDKHGVLLNTQMSIINPFQTFDGKNILIFGSICYLLRLKWTFHSMLWKLVLSTGEKVAQCST